MFRCFDIVLKKYQRFQQHKNILDNNNPNYYHPGAREGEGNFNLLGDAPGTSYGDQYVPYFTQRPRFMTLKLSYSF